MITTTENFVPHRDLYEILVEHGALTDREIAARMGVSASTAWQWARAGVMAGHLYRDEFGRYAPWCPWPRPGL